MAGRVEDVTDSQPLGTMQHFINICKYFKVIIGVGTNGPV